VNPQALEQTIKAVIPKSSIKNESETSMTVVIPFSENASLASLFDTLEKNKKDLGIETFGVSLTTLEDVF